MSPTTIDILQLPSRLNEAIRLANSGTEVIVTENNVPRARLVPLSVGGKRVAGLHAGAIQLADDFDAPLPDDFWLGNQ